MMNLKLYIDKICFITKSGPAKASHITNMILYTKDSSVTNTRVNLKIMRVVEYLVNHDT